MRKEDVKIVIFSNLDKVGGAAYECFHYVEMLRACGYDAIEVVRHKTDHDDFVYAIPGTPIQKKPLFQRVIHRIWPPKKKIDISSVADDRYTFFWDETEMGYTVPVQSIVDVVPFQPTLILVGHVNSFLNTNTIAELCRLWNCHAYMMCGDISPYTGGCHVHRECRGFETGCKDCPAVKEQDRKADVAHNFELKLQGVFKGNIGVAYSTQWLLNEINKSLLFKDQPKMYYPMNTDIKLYTPANRNIAKQIFDIDKTSHTILCGSQSLSEERKGFSYFIDGLHHLWKILPEDIRQSVIILMVGKEAKSVDELVQSMPPFRYHYIPFIKDLHYLSLLYQATDVFVCPSLEDAGPMMVAEAMACGTPVVAFKTGLMSDPNVLNETNGCAVDMEDAKGLAEGIKRIVSLGSKEFRAMSQAARKVVVEQMSEKVTIAEFDKFIENL